MTINEAIRKLKKIEEAHGTGVIIYFDCPNCKISFTPNIVGTTNVHLTTRSE